MLPGQFGGLLVSQLSVHHKPTIKRLPNCLRLEPYALYSKKQFHTFQVLAIVETCRNPCPTLKATAVNYQRCGLYRCVWLSIRCWPHVQATSILTLANWIYALPDDCCHRRRFSDGLAGIPYERGLLAARRNIKRQHVRKQRTI